MSYWELVIFVLKLACARIPISPFFTSDRDIEFPL